MKTPYLDVEIEKLSSFTLNNYGKGILTEYQAIKKQLETNPIVSTPEKPVWVMDEYGAKRILFADFGEKCISRYLLIDENHEEDFLNGKKLYWCWSSSITPYAEKVSIEVTKDEAAKVEEFLKGLRK
jgi:hypothetical protein